MRNYIEVFIGQVFFNFGSPPDQQQSALAGSVPDLNEEMGLLSNYLQGVGANVTGSTINGQYFVKLDKRNLVFLLRDQAEDIVLGDIGQLPYGDNPNTGTLFDSDSPKNDPDWPSSDGKRTGPTKGGQKGDFSGAPGLFTFVNNLPKVATAVLKSKVSTRLYRARIAGIIMEIFNNVILDKLTVTDASTQFAALVANNLELFESIS